MQGLHLTADLYKCACRQDLLINAEAIAQMCRSYTQESGLTLVAEQWFTFPDYQGQPGGVTGMLLLAESHLAVHTWPETLGVTLDVYVCNFSEDNSSKAETLLRSIIEAFQPERASTNRLLRGESDEPKQGDFSLMLEELNTNSFFGFKAKVIKQAYTGFQNMQILETPQFGRALRLDDYFMTSEREEFFYHECLTHPAALSHPEPKKVLVVGGGDGGTAEELLKYPSIEQIVVAELDSGVVDASREYFQEIHRGSFDNPRVSLQIGDGFEFMRQSRERYDLIIMDLTDPGTPAAPLYEKSFFKLSKQVLEDSGALVLHLGSPVFEPERVKRIVADLKETFKLVCCYGLYIPLYGTYWGMAVASDMLDAKALSASEVELRLSDRKIGDLNYYNPEVHAALFALPNYYQKLIR